VAVEKIANLFYKEIVELSEYVITKYGLISVIHWSRSKLKAVLYRFHRDESNARNFMALSLVICFQKCIFALKKGLVYFRQLIEVYRSFAAPLICFDGGSLRGTAFSGTVDRSSYDGNK
jgi:hypothetical protein